MIEVTFRLAEDINDVSGARIQQLVNLDYTVVRHPEGHTVHIHNLDVTDDDPQEYGNVCVEAYTV